jgi:hypothetical protein
MSFIEPQDVVERLMRRKPHWFHGRPKIELSGNPGEFGVLRFDFIDKVVEYRIFIADRQVILDAAEMGILNFSRIVNKLWEES